jgi:hypothetical protein
MQFKIKKIDDFGDMPITAIVSQYFDCFTFTTKIEPIDEHSVLVTIADEELDREHLDKIITDLIRDEYLLEGIENVW